MKLLLYLGLVAGLFLAGCSNHSTTENHTEEDHVHDELTVDHDHDNVDEESEEYDHGSESEEHDHDHGNAITFTHEQAEKIEFETAYPEYKPFGAVIKTTAIVQAAPTKQVVLTANTNGVVNFLSDDLVEGKSVSKNTSIFSITGAGMGDDNASIVYSSALTTYETQKENYERIQKLAEKQITSQKELLEAKSSYEQAKTIYENLQQNYSSTGQIIQSSVSGTVGEIYITNGQYVNPGDPVAMIVNSQQLQLKAEVQQKYAADLQNISEVNYRLAAQEDWSSLTTINGMLLSVGTQVSSQSFLIPIYFGIENNGNILPGSFVEMNIKTASETNQVVVPSTALLEQQGNYFVFVEVEPELYSKTQVTIGDSDGVQTSITSGLHADDLIVTSGAVMVNLASASGSLDPHAGHMH